MNTKEFITGLDKLNFVQFKDNTLLTTSGFKITYEVQLMGGALSMYPIQFILRVRKSDTHIMSWGCSSNEDNAIAASWWQKKVYAMDDMEYTRKSENKARLTEAFNELTK